MIALNIVRNMCFIFFVVVPLNVEVFYRDILRYTKLQRSPVLRQCHILLVFLANIDFFQPLTLDH